MIFRGNAISVRKLVEEYMMLGKELGVGNTATVYEWGQGKVIKLFHNDYPRKSIEKEFQNARIIANLNFEKPQVHKIVVYGKRIGIIYDEIEGESLENRLLETGDIEGCALHMAKLHKKIINNRVSNIPSYKEFLRYYIARIIDLQDREKILSILDELPDGDMLCHGDLHPGNIFISGEETTVIDFMNICRGHFLYDVARTTFLIQYTPVPEEVEDKEALLKLKRLLTDLYLVEMGVTREMIQNFLTVIMVARRGENPEEIATE